MINCHQYSALQQPLEVAIIRVVHKTCTYAHAYTWPQ